MVAEKGSWFSPPPIVMTAQMLYPIAENMEQYSLSQLCSLTTTLYRVQYESKFIGVAERHIMAQRKKTREISRYLVNAQDYAYLTDVTIAPGATVSRTFKIVHAGGADTAFAFLFRQIA